MLLEMVANATRQESEINWEGEKQFADNMATVPKLPQKVNFRTYKLES